MPKPSRSAIAIRSLTSLSVVAVFVFSPILPALNLVVHAATPPVPDFTYAVLAAAPRTDVLNPTGNNVTTNSNGSEWYFNTNQSMGFANSGSTITQSSADVQDGSDPLRLSWHLSGGANFDGGWRAGATTGLNDDHTWKKEIYQTNSLPSYYPSGPQTNVSVATVTGGGWVKCFSSDYGAATIPIADVLSACTGDYLMLAGGTVLQNRIEVKTSGNTILNTPGGTQNADAIYAGDTLDFSLFEPDGSTSIPWTNYQVFISNCSLSDCSGPGSPLVNPENWGGGDSVTDGTYVIPTAADYMHLAIFVADDSTGDPVDANWIFLNVTHIPVERTVSDCTELQNINDQLSDNYTLTQDIDCSDTVNWNLGEGFLPLGDSVLPFSGGFDGAGHTISNLYIDRSSSDYVGLFGMVGLGANVQKVNLTNVYVVGNNYVGGVAGVLSGTMTNVSSAGEVFGYSRVGGLVGIHIDPSGLGSSSPLVYTWDGTRYQYVADVGRGMPRNVVGDDYAQIDSNLLAPKDGKYSINISEEYNEIVYYDEVALMTFDHAPGYRVLTTTVKGNDGQFYTVSDNPSNPLQSCTDQYGNDCLSALQASDDQWSHKDASNLNYWTMNFGDLSSASNIKLVLQGARDYSIKSGSTVKYVQVKDAGGNWVNAYASSQLSTLYGAPLTEVIDMTGKFLTNDYSVRVAFDRTRMNYFAIDTSAPISYTMNTVHPDSANLQFRGFSAIDKTNYWKHDFYTVSPTPEEPFAPQTGNFTKYGDVSSLLQETDNQPVVIHSGDNMDITFPYSAAADGTERSFVLYNWAQFKHADMGAVGRTVEPMPFVGMSAYPYSAPEAYPLTPANLAYLRDWNTRVVTGEIGSSSTIITSHSSADVHGNNQIGGLVGYNDKTISGSYATGNVYAGDNSNAEAGGLVGYNNGNTGYIEDSYATGDVSGDVDYSGALGGLVGYNGGEIYTTYATGDVIGNHNIGGFVGEHYGYIENAFSRGTVSGVGNVGGFVGYNQSDLYNVYTTSQIIDESGPVGALIGYHDSGTLSTSFWNTDTTAFTDACGNTDCSSDVVGIDSATMKLVATFTDAGWDFDNVWDINAAFNDSYPTFLYWIGDADGDGILNYVEYSGPNYGDANNDGTSDDSQSNTATFMNSVGDSYAVLDAPSACSVVSASTDAESGLALTDAGYNYPAGMLSYNLSCGTPGYSAEINLYFYGMTSTDVTLRKYSVANSSYSTVSGANVQLVTVGGQQVLKVTYTVVDGGPLDQDGVANGTIIDPVGVGVLGVSTPNTGFGFLSR